jgi:hypothetical protein
MESTDPTAVAASRTTNTHIQYGNRLKIRVYVRGDELELTDERIDNREAPINVQGIISAFTEVLKINPNTIPIDTRSIAENPNDSGFSTQKPEFKTEIMRLRQLAQKFEGEVMNLRQLLQESKEENEQLKIRFRSATHMKAAELAQQFSRLHSVQSAADGRETEGIPGLVEPFTPEQKPTEFILNSKVKEIDFFNLDDILGKDNAVCVPSKRKAEDVSEEDDNAVTNNSGSGSGTVSIC